MVQHRLIHAVAALLLLADAALAAQSGGMRPGVTRRVTTGTTDTATYSDINGQISWQSTAAAPKTQTLPACDNTIDGLRIAVIDGQGTASTYPITVNAASGNVGGSSAGVALTMSGQGATFACDGATTNWALAGVVPAGGPIVFPQIVSEQVCPAQVSGTGAAKTFTPVCAVSTITIDTNGQTILVPNNMPGASGMAGYTLDITYSGSGTLAPNWGAGTAWTNKTAPPVCSGTVTSGCISAVAGAFDRIVGQSQSTTQILYGAPLTNYGAPAVVSKVRVQGSAAAYSSTSSGTSTWVGTQAIPAGQTVLCMVLAGGSSDPTGVTDGGGNALAKLGSSATLFSGVNATLWYKIGTASNASSTPTFTASHTVTSAHQMACDVYSGITSLDGSNVSTQQPAGTGTNGVTVTISTTLDGDLIYGISANSSTALSVAGTGFTIRISNDSTPSYHPSSEDQIQATHNASTPVTFTNTTAANGFVTWGVGLH